MRDSPDGLLLREALFCRQYLICKGNIDQAAKEAGYISEGAGRKLMKREDIRRVIDRERAKVFDQLDVSVDRVLREVARIAFFDPRRLFRADGTTVPFCELPDDCAAALSVSMRRNRTTTHFRLAQKLRALDMLGQYHKLWDGAGNVDSDRLAEVIAALQEGPVTDEDGNPIQKKEPIN